MTNRPNNSSNPPTATLRIGAFVLETLTLGMYGEPRHTLREYVQNSFDSIREAQRSNQISGPGKVRISYLGNEIRIRDNGVGVSASAAWDTLTSIGASKKNRKHDAGFRGIGRLAGMAYCKKLQFRTSFLGESEVSVITFDAAALLGGMDPDEGGAIELSDLLLSNVTLDQSKTADKEIHFFEVALIGLNAAPEELTDTADVERYLRETLPLRYNSDWEQAGRILEEYHKYFGQEIPTIDVVLIADDKETHLFKHYGDKYKNLKSLMNLDTVQFFDDGDGGRFWGWVGYMEEPGAITDEYFRGIRIRVKNIQVDGTEIFDKLFRRDKPSYARFNSYYVGEFFINPSSIVPNARRDGFEETEEWASIKSDFVTHVCKPLAKRAYERSREAQEDVQKLLKKIDVLDKRSDRLAVSSKATYDQVINLLHEAKSLRMKSRNSLKKISDADAVWADEGKYEMQLGEQLRNAVITVEAAENQAKSLIGSVLNNDTDERVGSLRERLRSEIIEEILDLLRPRLETGTYRWIENVLRKRTEEV